MARRSSRRGGARRRRRLEQVAEERLLVGVADAPHDDEARRTEGDRPDQAGGETQADCGEGQEHGHQANGERRGQNDGVAVAQCAPSDRGVFAGPWDREPGGDVEREAAAPDERQQHEQRADDVRVDAGRARQAARNTGDDSFVVAAPQRAADLRSPPPRSMFFPDCVGHGWMIAWPAVPNHG